VNRVLVTALLVAFAACTPSRAREGDLIRNGGFEDGLSGWATDHQWYVQGDKGLSATSVDETLAHGGTRSLRIQGDGNRGIVLQNCESWPDRFVASGWIRCEGLDGAQATILLEWKDVEGKWLSGLPVGSVTGTSDWTRVEIAFDAPAEAHSVSIDCLTSAPNKGTAWFDDLSLTDTTTDTEPPGAVTFAASAPEGESGAVLVDWSGWTAEPDVARYRVYVAEQPFSRIQGLAPAKDENRFAKRSVVRGLEVGRTYYAAVQAVDQDGNARTDVEAIAVTTMDRKAPRALRPRVWPVAAATPSVMVEWTPSIVDGDIRSYEVLWREVAQPDAVRRSQAVEGTSYIVSDLPASTAIEVAVVARDAAGNVAEETWVALQAPAGAPTGFSARAADGAALDAAISREPSLWPGLDWAYATAPGYHASPAVLAPRDGSGGAVLTLEPAATPFATAWAASALDKVFRDAAAPGEAGTVDLLAARNESETGQMVVRADADLGAVSAWCTPLRSEGRAEIAPAEVHLNWVGYVQVDENSRATPKEHVVRVAPAEFPDELLEAESVEVASGQAQPLFVRVDVPRDAQPGTYHGAVRVTCARGSIAVPVQLEVVPFTFPDRTRLLVTNWFGEGPIAEKHGVEPWSEEFWRVLRVYALTMARHHQNIAWASPSLVQVWQEEDGSFSYDYSRFDRWVELFDEAGLGARIEIGHYGGRKTGEWECPEFVFSERPATRRADGSPTTVPVPEFAHAMQEHLRQRGWLERSMQHIADEPIPVNEDSWRGISRIVHEAAPDLRRIDAIHVTDLDGDLEVWVPQLNFYRDAYDALIEKQKQGIAEVWFYIAWVPQYPFPNRLIDVPTLNARIAHWMNYLYGAPGYLHWGLNWWNLKLGNFSPGDEWIMWPGEDGPHSSLRYEAQREGLEDCEYLSLLEDKHRAAGEADPARRSKELAGQLVRAMTDYETDPAKLEAVRRQLVREVAGE
jgi:hypothetical protein